MPLPPDDSTYDWRCFFGTHTRSGCRRLRISSQASIAPSRAARVSRGETLAASLRSTYAPLPAGVTVVTDCPLLRNSLMIRLLLVRSNSTS